MASLERLPYVAFYWDGEWYEFPLFSPTTWVEVDITPFTQRLGTGSLSLTDLTGIAAVEQLSFAGGSGQERLIELNRYQFAQHVWPVSYDRGVTMGPGKITENSLLANSLNTIGMPTTAIYGFPGSDRQAGAFAYGDKVFIKMINSAPVDVTGDLHTVMVNKGVINGNFSDGLNYWVQKSDKGTVTVQEVGGRLSAVMKYDTSQGTSSDTYIGLVSAPQPVAKDARIIVSFDAQHVSGDNLGMTVSVEPYYYDPLRKYYVNDPTHVVTQAITLSTGTWQTYTMSTLDLSLDSRYRFFKVRFQVNGTTTPQTSEVAIANVNAVYEGSGVQFPINDILWNGYALFVATDVGIFYLNESRIDASPNIFDNPPPSTYTWSRATWRVCDAYSLGVADGYVWYTERWSNLCHYGSDFLGQDLEWGSADDRHPLYWRDVTGDVYSDIAAIQIGPGMIPSRNITGFNNSIYMFRPDGAWAIYHDGVDYVTRNVLTFPYSPTNFNTVTVHDGSLVFTAAGRVWRYTGTTLVDISPDDRDDYGRQVELSGIAATGDFLWGVSRNGFLMVWTAGSWHTVELIDYIRQDQGGRFAVAIGAYELGDYWDGSTYPTLVIPIAEPLYSTAQIDVYEYFMKSREPERFYTAPVSGVLVTSWFDGGLTAVDKCFESVTLYYSFDYDFQRFALDPSWYQRITVYFEYRLENGDVHRIEVGRVQYPHDEPNIVEDDASIRRVIRRTTTFDIPNIVSREGRLIFKLENNGPTNYTPRLYGYMVKYVPRPPYLRGYSVSLKVSDDSFGRSGGRAKLAAKEQLDLLWKMRDSRAPIRFRDEHGTEANVYLSAIKVINMGEREGIRGHDYRVDLSLVETEGAFGPPQAS